MDPRARARVRQSREGRAESERGGKDTAEVRLVGGVPRLLCLECLDAVEEGRGDGKRRGETGFEGSDYKVKTTGTRNEMEVRTERGRGQREERSRRTVLCDGAWRKGGKRGVVRRVEAGREENIRLLTLSLIPEFSRVLNVAESLVTGTKKRGLSEKEKSGEGDGGNSVADLLSSSCWG